NAIMAAPHRKIELQTPDDLRYLVDNVIAAARAKIDLHLPPVPLQGEEEGGGSRSGVVVEEDRLRKRVEEIVQGVSPFCYFPDISSGDISYSVASLPSIPHLLSFLSLSPTQKKRLI